MYMTEMLMQKKDIAELLNKELLQENMELKKENEVLKNKALTIEIKSAINKEFRFYGYIDDYIDYLKREDSKNKTYIEYRQDSLVYARYIELCKQYGFDLVDKVIEDMVDEKRKEMESE